ncbi:MAG: LicD family protein [Ruminococcaceae bacterium]|nr:LicD family protein [Oscillospiraceae bacterium]
MRALRQLQLTELEILRFFDNLCRENGLKYYIVAGTLLGAVRHGGFIPWDDDIDVAMPRADFERLKALMAVSQHDCYFYQCHDTEPNYVFGFSKIRLKGTAVCESYLENVDMEKGIYIDIFPLDPCPDGTAGKLMFKAVEVISCALMTRSGMDFCCGYTKKYMRALYRLLSLLPISALIKLRNAVVSVFGKLADGKLYCTVHGCHGFPNETYRKQWLGDGCELSFENMTVFAPADPHAALTNMYGDYLMPPEDKSGHFEIEKTILISDE